MQHNRDVGLPTDDFLVVLGLKKAVTYYRRDGRAGAELALVPAVAVTEDMRWLAADAAALFQYAYETYHAGAYVVPVTLHRPRTSVLPGAGWRAPMRHAWLGPARGIRSRSP